jgi:hypothetical protein
MSKMPTKKWRDKRDYNRTVDAVTRMWKQTCNRLDIPITVDSHPKPFRFNLNGLPVR